MTSYYDPSVDYVCVQFTVSHLTYRPSNRLNDRLID